MASVAPFLRPRAKGGRRVSNPILDACTDTAIHLAVLHFEAEQERATAHNEMVEAHERARRADSARQD